MTPKEVVKARYLGAFTVQKPLSERITLIYMRQFGLRPHVLFCLQMLSCKAQKLDSPQVETKPSVDSVRLQKVIQLKSVNLSQYVGRTVGEALQDSVLAKYDEYFFSDEPPGVLSGASFHYDERLYISVFIDRPKLQVAFNESRKWDFDLFLKEEIVSIEIVED